MIASGGTARDQALKTVYKEHRHKVYSYVLNNSGSEDDAKDVYQESMLSFYENVKSGKFKAESSVGTYIYSIAKFKWLNQIKRSKVRSEHYQKVDLPKVEPSSLVSLLDAEAEGRILEVLAELGDSCKELLIQNIYYDASMKEIAESQNYSSEQIVRNKKYKCLKRLKELIAEKPYVKKILERDE